MDLLRPTPVTTRRIEVRGPVSAGVVWARYEDPARWSGWAPHLSSVDVADADHDHIHVGMTGTVHGPARLLGAHFIVLAVDPEARTWKWEVRSGPLTLHLAHDVTPSPGGGSIAGLHLTGPAVVVLPYLPLAAWALRRLTHLPEDRRAPEHE